MKNFLTILAIVALVVPLFVIVTPDTAEATGFGNAVVVQNVGRSRSRVVVRPSVSRTRVSTRGFGGAAVAVRAPGVAVNVGGFNRLAFVPQQQVFVNNGFRSAGFNNFGTRTVVDARGNVFEQNAFGQAVLRRPSSFGVFQPSFNNFNTGFNSFNNGFSSFGGVRSVNVVRGFGGCGF